MHIHEPWRPTARPVYPSELSLARAFRHWVFMFTCRGGRLPHRELLRSLPVIDELVRSNTANMCPYKRRKKETRKRSDLCWEIGMKRYVFFVWLDHNRWFARIVLGLLVFVSCSSVFLSFHLLYIQPEIRGVPPPALRGHTANLIGHKIFLFGGFDGKSRTNEVYVLDTRARSWLRVTDASSSCSPFASSSSPQGDLTAAPSASRLAGKRGSEGEGSEVRGAVEGSAGGGGGGSSSSSSGRWDPSLGSGATATQATAFASATGGSGPPPARQSHSAALVGNQRVFIFGGFDGFRWLNDLYILDASHFEEDVLLDATVRQFVENMRTLVNSPDFSDIALVVEGRDIPAHKCILAANCEYFRQMFVGSMMESRQNRITIPGWSYEAYVAMIEFLYTGKLSDTRTHVACEVRRPLPRNSVWWTRRTDTAGRKQHFLSFFVPKIFLFNSSFCT